MKFVIVLLLLPYKLFTQENKQIKDGLAIVIGIGNTFGGGGLKVEYLKSVKEKTCLVPFLSIGSESISTDAPGKYTGYAIGLNMEYGKKFRLILGVNYGSNGVGYDKNDSDPANSGYANIHIRVGPACTIGYKLTGLRGFIYEVFMSMSYVNNPASINRNYFFWPGGGAGIGYKF